MKVFISEIAKKGCSGVSFEGCGVFFISKSHSFLRVSPDRIIRLFDLAAKHPEEGSNAEMSVYLYHHLASFEQ